MKTGILIIARMGSTRLSQKHFIKANGKPFIEWLTNRMKIVFEKELLKGEVELVICTSCLPENSFFLDFFKDKGVSVFFGDNNNIPKRQLECAESLFFENIVSIDGDDILCSPYAAKTVSEKLNAGSQYIKTEGLPLGMNVIGYKTSFLKKSLERKTLGTLETGWGRIFDHNQLEVIKVREDDFDYADLRFTLDYKEDALFFEKTITTLGERIVNISDADLITYVKEHKLYEINNSLNDEYWTNFQKNVTKENND